MKNKATKGRSFKLLSMVAGQIKNEAVARAKNFVSQQNLDLSATRVKQMKDLVATLAEAKGAAMKFGQILALEAKDILPDEAVAILETLQGEAVPRPYSEIEAILQKEWGEKFSLVEVDPTPLACASIGQVHRGVYQGKQMAIKVQYPGIDATIDSDLALFSKIIAGIKVIFRKGDIDYNSFLTEMKTMFLQETDYLSEAQFTERYQQNFSSDSTLVVPSIFPELSSKHVLVTSFENGLTLNRALREIPFTPQERLFYAQKFLELYTREFCEFGFVQTDPNLGNFLIDHETRRLVTLDFGAMKEFDLPFRQQYSGLIFAALAEDKEQVLQKAQSMGLIDSRESAEAKEALFQLISTSMNPFKYSSYDFSDKSYREAMRILSKNLIQELKYSPPPQKLIFLHRKLGGIFQIIKRFDVQMDLRPYLAPFKALKDSSSLVI